MSYRVSAKPRHRAEGTVECTNLRRVDDSGRILIPATLRQALGIRESTLLEIAMLNETTIVVKRTASRGADALLDPLMKSVRALTATDLSALSNNELKSAITESEQAVYILKQELYSRVV